MDSSDHRNRVEPEDAEIGDLHERETMLREEEEIRQETTVDLNRDAPPGPQSPVPQEATAHPPPPTNGPSHAERRKMHFNDMTKKIKIIPSNRQGQLNTTFLATIPGVLKIAEIMIGFVVFILAICSDRRSTGAAWTEHISFETTVVVGLLLLGYVAFPHLTLRDEQTREGLIVLELLFYGVNTLLYFVAIWLMVHLSASWTAEGRGAAIMAAILCVALTVLYAVETFLKFRAWKGENAPGSKVVSEQNNTGVYPTHELRREPHEVA